MAVLGRSDDAALARKFAGALAAELAAVGISLDYAPVLDIHTNPKNPVIGDRALSEKPEIVAKLGRVIIEELQRAGVAACGKHFPGHGDTATDSHFELPIVEHAPDRLRAIEFAPFKAAIEARVAFIMTAHVLVVSIDDERPATLSPKIVQGILRDELGFDGVIVSDDLEMKAIANTYPPGEAAVVAIAAGCDAVLMCGTGKTADIELQGAGARGADSCGRGRAVAAQAGRGGARAQSPGEGALSARLAAAHRGPAADGHRVGAASRHLRADGGVRLTRMLKPKRLRPGDKVAIVSPASSFLREEFDKGIAEIQRLGFEPVFEESVFAQHGGYLSGEGRVRADAFLNAWRDPSVRALIAVRGGYGSVHLLPFLEKEDLRQTPKAFIGYSDLTTVLTYLTGRCGIVSFHGPMLDRRLSRGIDAYDRDSFVGALTSAEPLGELAHVAPRDVQQRGGCRSADGRNARAA